MTTPSLTPGAARTARAIDWRLGAILWLLGGMPGVVGLLWLLAPLVRQLVQPVWVVLLVGGLLIALLLALAVALGLVLAPRLGLGAPALSAWLQGRPVLPVLRAQLLPALCGGLAGALCWCALARIAPASVSGYLRLLIDSDLALLIDLLRSVQTELLLRWGLLTLLLWLAWRLLQRGQGAPAKALVALTVLLSAALFAFAPVGIEHALTGDHWYWRRSQMFAMAGDFALGLLAGGLYVRCGLEAAIAAQLLAHALAYPLLRAFSALS